MSNKSSFRNIFALLCIATILGSSFFIFFPLASRAGSPADYALEEYISYFYNRYSKHLDASSFFSNITIPLPYDEFSSKDRIAPYNDKISCRCCSVTVFVTLLNSITPVSLSSLPLWNSSRALSSLRFSLFWLLIFSCWGRLSVERSWFRGGGEGDEDEEECERLFRIRRR